MTIILEKAKQFHNVNSTFANIDLRKKSGCFTIDVKQPDY